MRLAIGLAITLAAFLVVGRRAWYLYRLIGSGQPAPGRMDGIGARFKSQVAEVFGQRKLLKWSVPGVAHFFTFWAFIVLAATILRGLRRAVHPDFAIPVIGHWTVLGFLEDFFGVAVLIAIALLRDHPDPAGAVAARASLPVLRLAHRGGLARAVHDLQRGVDAVPLPRRADQHRQLPLRGRRLVDLRVQGDRHRARAAGRERQRGAGDRSASCCRSA